MRKLYKTAALILIAVICLAAGCTRGTGPAGTTAGGIEPAVTPADTTGHGTASGGSATTDDPDASAFRADITTSGGAVIVGSVKKDAEGLYLEPGKPLNIKITGTSGTDPGIGAVRSIRFDAQVAAGKMEYLGSIVTVLGRLSFEPAGAGVCIYPYKIEYGRHADACCAVPGLVPPDGGQYVYDPARLPEKMRVGGGEDGVYRYNPYALSASALRFMGSDFADFYVSFIDAYLNYETSIPCSSAWYAWMLPVVLENEFPLYGAEVVTDTLTYYDPDRGTVTWSYKTASRGAHDSLVESFRASADEFLGGVTSAMGERERAGKVYNNITKRVRYDYDILRASYVPAYHPSYRAYCEHTGICSTFARAYAQMLTQVGIDNEFCATDIRGEVVGHAWVMAEIEGKNYFFDPTYELSTTAGRGYVYFGMTLSTRLSSDSRIIKSTIVVGTYDARLVGDVDISRTVLPVS